MKSRTLRVVAPEPKPARDPAPAAGRFVSFTEFEAVKQLLVDALADYEDVTTEPDAVARIGNGGRSVRAALRALA